LLGSRSNRDVHPDEEPALIRQLLIIPVHGLALFSRSIGDYATALSLLVMLPAGRLEPVQPRERRREAQRPGRLDDEVPWAVLK
jgi:hypothetical protein